MLARVVLKPGVVSLYVEGSDEPQRIFVAGGFADVTGTLCTVSAEEAVNVRDLNQQDIEKSLAELNEDISRAEDASVKTPKLIAADIKRRLLPDYLKHFDSAKIEKKKTEAQKIKINQITNLICQISEGRSYEKERYPQRVYFTNAEAEIYNEERIDLKLRDLTITQAIQIISLIKNTSKCNKQ